jgi:hypothetical protein
VRETKNAHPHHPLFIYQVPELEIAWTGLSGHTSS